MPPKPPKRGILKGSRANHNRDSSNHQTNSSINSNHNSSSDSTALLIQNTLHNEMITYENITSKRITSDNHHTEEVNKF